MILKKYRGKSRLAVIIGTSLSLTLITLLFGLAWPVLPSQAGPTLPPVDPPTPIPDPGGNPSGGGGENDDTSEDRGGLLIAFIELQANSGGTWSVVQWQDSAGNWHDVEGWRGALPTNGTQRWAVEAKDFNTGPFRWVVTDSQGGSALGMSDAFNLPAGANETLHIKVD